MVRASRGGRKPGKGMLGIPGAGAAACRGRVALPPDCRAAKRAGDCFSYSLSLPFRRLSPASRGDVWSFPRDEDSVFMVKLVRITAMLGDYLDPFIQKTSEILSLYDVTGHRVLRKTLSQKTVQCIARQRSF